MQPQLRFRAEVFRFSGRFDGNRYGWCVMTAERAKAKASVMAGAAPEGILRDGYDTGGFYDEMFELDAGGMPVPRAHYAELVSQIAAMDGTAVRRAAELANRSFLNRGVTFTIYSGDSPGAERILPFDPIPRVVSAEEWAVVEAGLRQRITALNQFVHDVYHDQQILHDGIVPRRLIVLARHFRREVVGIDVPDNHQVTFTLPPAVPPGRTKVALRMELPDERPVEFPPFQIETPPLRPTSSHARRPPSTGCCRSC